LGADSGSGAEAAEVVLEDRKQRLQAIGDARRVLEEPLADARGSEKPRRETHVGWAVAAIAMFALAALAFIHFRQKPPESPMVRFDFPAPPGTTFAGNANGVPPAPVVSPDGRKIAFLATGSGGNEQMIWIRSLDAEDARPLPGTEDVTDFPFWSPDSRSLGFVSSGKLKRIDVAGGARGGVV
jgi:eukaryotic-like serine/threonine-protein kinase